MSSPRVRRLLTLPLACACAFSATAAGEVAGQVVPELPSVPPIQLPSLPETPPLKPPSQIEVPSVPQVPDVSVPRPSVPSPSVPDTPVTPRGTSPAAPSAGATQGATPTAGAPAATSSTSSASPARGAAARASRRRAADRRRVAADPRERRFQRSVKSLWACSYAVGGFERRVLVRRAGLGGFAPASAADVASRLNVSVQRVRTAQRSGLRRLRGANRADGCAMSAPTGGLGSSAKTLLAVATAPPLATDAGDAVAKAPERPSANDRVEVLGTKRASTGVNAAAAPRAKLKLASAGEGPPPWLLVILALLALALVAPLLLRRRHESAPEAGAPQAIAPPPPPDPNLWFDMEPWAPHRPEPPPEPAEPAPPPATPDEPARRHGAARAAGLAATGLASLAVGLVMRSRRKR